MYKAVPIKEVPPGGKFAKMERIGWYTCSEESYELFKGQYVLVPIDEQESEEDTSSTQRG